VTPSKLGSAKPAWMNFDDAWVDEVRRGLLACKVFLWYPLYCNPAPFHQSLSIIDLTLPRACLQSNDKQLDLPSRHHEAQRRTQRHCFEFQSIVHCHLDSPHGPRCLPRSSEVRIPLHPNQTHCKWFPFSFMRHDLSYSHTVVYL